MKDKKYRIKSKKSAVYMLWWKIDDGGNSMATSRVANHIFIEHLILDKVKYLKESANKLNFLENYLLSTRLKL